MDSQYEHPIDEVITVLANEDRRTLLACIADQAASVADLAERCSRPPAQIERDIRMLADAGLVTIGPIVRATERVSLVSDADTVTLSARAVDGSRVELRFPAELVPPCP